MLEKDPDFIYSKRFDFSIEKMLERYPDGVSNKNIAQVLLITEEEVERIYQDSILKIRAAMKIEIE